MKLIREISTVLLLVTLTSFLLGCFSGIDAVQAVVVAEVEMARIYGKASDFTYQATRNKHGWAVEIRLKSHASGKYLDWDGTYSRYVEVDRRGNVTLIM